MISGIYKITNNINGKIYVGQSIDIPKRIYEHKYKAFCKDDISYNSAIHNAFRKYGLDNFTFEILEEVSIKELDDKEIFYIKELNSLSPNGYNIQSGGQKYKVHKREPNRCRNCNTEISYGAKLCLECCKKSQSKNIPPKEELEKLLNDDFNYTHIGNIYNVSVNTIKKWCKRYEIQKPIIEKQEKVKKQIKKPVAQIDINTGKVIMEFNGVNEAARALGKKKSSHITEVCKGRLKQAYGYSWKYIDMQ